MYCCACCKYFRNDKKEGSDGYCFIDGTDVRLEDVCDEFDIQELKESKRGSEMTNEEWLSGLSTEEKAKMISNHSSCSFCSYKGNKCMDDTQFQDCENGICEWLNKKHTEPMPEVKAGDLVIDKKGNVYLMDKYCCYKMEENHRPMKIDKDIVTRIDRVSDEGYSCVWRAGND